MKKCSKCGESKDLTCFSSYSIRKDGKHNQCKDCKNALACAYNQTPKGKYLVYKHGASQRGHTFTITMDKFMEFWNKDCSYCGEKIKGIGLDRINNSVGYEENNIV